MQAKLINGPADGWIISLGEDRVVILVALVPPSPLSALPSLVARYVRSTDYFFHYDGVEEYDTNA
jgi:hypothetical protein